MIVINSRQIFGLRHKHIHEFTLSMDVLEFVSHFYLLHVCLAIPVKVANYWNKYFVFLYFVSSI